MDDLLYLGAVDTRLKKANESIVKLRDKNDELRREVYVLNQRIKALKEKYDLSQERMIKYLLKLEAPIIVKRGDIDRIAAACRATKKLVLSIYRETKRNEK